MTEHEFLFCAVLAILFLLTLTFIISLICFLKVFYSKPRKPLSHDEYELPPGGEYVPFYPEIRSWIMDIKAKDREEISIKSFDGLTLRGYYYEYSPNSPIELLFHGYKGNSERDLNAGVERCAKLGRSCCLIDHRASGRSDGTVITFGVNERRDCLDWINYINEKYPGRELVIGGVSMGAATVMMAAGEGLPENVVSVMADCGYSSQKDIIKKVVKEMHLPANLLYPFIKLGARIFGGFDLEEATPIEAVQKSKTPIIFIHGSTDNFVPYSMSEELYRACASHKKLVKIENAGHGLAYPVNKTQYVESLREFEQSIQFNKLYR